MLKELNLPSNLKVDDLSIFEPPKGTIKHMRVNCRNPPFRSFYNQSKTASCIQYVNRRKNRRNDHSQQPSFRHASSWGHSSPSGCLASILSSLSSPVVSQAPSRHSLCKDPFRSEVSALLPSHPQRLQSQALRSKGYRSRSSRSETVSLPLLSYLVLLKCAEVTSPWVPDLAAMTTLFLSRVFPLSLYWIVRALGLRTALSLKWQEEHLIIVDACRVEVSVLSVCEG